MFVLNELERLLQDASAGSRPAGRTTVRDIERVDASKLELFDSMRLRDIDLGGLEDHHNAFNLEAYIAQRSYLTLDVLFASQMKLLVLDKLRQISERPYPAARLMICDHDAYRHLLKFHYVVKKIYPNEDGHRYLLHKAPFNVTAVMLLSDIVRLVERVGRPLAKINADQQSVHYDYSIIKQIFPYLKITDLVVVLGEIGNLKLKTLTLNASKSHQVIQFLTHFSRSAQLIELVPMKAKLGVPHLLYDNVSVFSVPNFGETVAAKDQASGRVAMKHPATANVHLEPTLLQLSFIAGRLQQLIGQLEWSLESITFRLNDPTGFSKIFCQILDSCEKSASKSSSMKRKKNPPLVPVRVLVLDRFFDFHGLLRHSSRYGPFLEQESLLATGDSFATLRLDKADRLDCLMQSASLTDVLKTVLEYSTASKDNTGTRRSPNTIKPQPVELNETGRTTSRQAICRHLEIVKSVYTSMSEGYLLLLKLEASLADIRNKVRKPDFDINNSNQLNDVLDQIKRIGVVLEQICSLPSKSLTLIDFFRVLLLLIDTINQILLFIPPESEAFKLLRELKIVLANRPEFKQSLEVPNDERGSGGRARKDVSSKQTVNLNEKLYRFDSLSLWNCGNRADISLEEIIDNFYHRKLDQKVFPTIKRPSTAHGLVKSVVRNKIIILVLGSISYDELTRMKCMESILMKRRAQPKQTKFKGQSVIPDYISGDIVIMSSGIISPNEFVISL